MTSDETFRTVLQQRRLVEDALLDAIRPIAMQIGLPALVDRLTPAITTALVELVPWEGAVPAAQPEAFVTPVGVGAGGVGTTTVARVEQGDVREMVRTLFNAAPLAPST